MLNSEEIGQAHFIQEALTDLSESSVANMKTIIEESGLCNSDSPSQHLYLILHIILDIEKHRPTLTPLYVEICEYLAQRNPRFLDILKWHFYRDLFRNPYFCYRSIQHGRFYRLIVEKEMIPSSYVFSIFASNKFQPKAQLSDSFFVFWDLIKEKAFEVYHRYGRHLSDFLEKYGNRYIYDGIHLHENTEILTIQRAIETDDSDLFKKALKDFNLDINGIIPYDPHLSDLPEMRYVQYAAHFGAGKIFKFLFMRKADMTDVVQYGISGGNLEIVRLLMQDSADFSVMLERAICFYQNEIASWIVSTFDQSLDSPIATNNGKCFSFDPEFDIPTMVENDCSLILLGINSFQDISQLLYKSCENKSVDVILILIQSENAELTEKINGTNYNIYQIADKLGLAPVISVLKEKGLTLEPYNEIDENFPFDYQFSDDSSNPVAQPEPVLAPLTKLKPKPAAAQPKIVMNTPLIMKAKNTPIISPKNSLPRSQHRDRTKKVSIS